MCISKLLDDANFCLASLTNLSTRQLTILIRLTVLQIVMETGQIGLRLSYDIIDTFKMRRYILICKSTFFHLKSSKLPRRLFRLSVTSQLSASTMLFCVWHKKTSSSSRDDDSSYSNIARDLENVSDKHLGLFFAA